MSSGFCKRLVPVSLAEERLGRLTMMTSSLHVISSMDRFNTGLSVFLSGLASSLVTHGHRVLILSAITDHHELILCDSEVRMTFVNNFKYWDRVLGIHFKNGLQELLKHEAFNVIHSHGIWLPCSHHACRVARKNKLPLVISTHGSLQPWAYNHKAWKKRAALALYQWRDFKLADALHATAPPEAENLRRFGLRQPIAVIPIGVSLPALGDKSDGLVRRPNIALFLSRIHPVKGIQKLLEVWAELNPTDWRLVIAGNDDQDHLAMVMDQIGKLELSRSVRYVGPVHGVVKDSLFRNADLFILPTYSENFGIVVGEALSYGIPVITTHGTPWTELRDLDCGWYIGTDKQSLYNAVQQALNMDITSLREMGRRGRELVKEKYQWSSVAHDMGHLYQWLSGAANIPQFVQQW